MLVVVYDRLHYKLNWPTRNNFYHFDHQRFQRRNTEKCCHDQSCDPLAACQPRLIHSLQVCVNHKVLLAFDFHHHLNHHLNCQLQRTKSSPCGCRLVSINVLIQTKWFLSRMPSCFSTPSSQAIILAFKNNSSRINLLSTEVTVFRCYYF